MTDQDKSNKFEAYIIAADLLAHAEANLHDATFMGEPAKVIAELAQLMEDLYKDYSEKRSVYKRLAGLEE